MKSPKYLDIRFVAKFLCTQAFPYLWICKTLCQNKVHESYTKVGESENAMNIVDIVLKFMLIYWSFEKVSILKSIIAQQFANYYVFSRSVVDTPSSIEYCSE